MCKPPGLHWVHFDQRTCLRKLPLKTRVIRPRTPGERSQNEIRSEKGCGTINQNLQIRRAIAVQIGLDKNRILARTLPAQMPGRTCAR